MLKLLKFSTKTCTPCTALSRYLPEVLQETGIECESFDIDTDEEKFTLYNVRSVPTLIFLKNDAEILRKVGIVPKQTLIDLINENK